MQEWTEVESNWLPQIAEVQMQETAAVTLQSRCDGSWYVMVTYPSGRSSCSHQLTIQDALNQMFALSNILMGSWPVRWFVGVHPVWSY